MGAGIHYPFCIHESNCYLEELGHLQGTYPNAEKCAKTMISLPVYPELTNAQAETVVKKMAVFYGK